MSNTDLERILNTWSVSESSRRAVIDGLTESSVISCPDHAICLPDLVLESSDLIDPLSTHVNLSDTMLLETALSTNICALPTPDLHTMNKAHVNTLLRPEVYLPGVEGLIRNERQSHLLSLDDITISPDGQIFSLKGTGVRSLTFEFCDLGIVFTEVRILDLSFNPHLDLRHVIDFLKAHNMKGLEEIWLYGTNHGQKDDERALEEIQKQVSIITLKTVKLYDVFYATTYPTITLMHLFYTLDHYNDHEVWIDDTSDLETSLSSIDPKKEQEYPIFIATNLILDSSIPEKNLVFLEKLCTSQIPYLPKLTDVWVDIPESYSFEPISFRTIPFRINGQQILTMLIPRTEISHITLSTEMLLDLRGKVYDFWHRTARIVPIDFEGDRFTKAGVYLYSPDAESAFNIAYFSTPLANPSVGKERNSYAMLTLNSRMQLVFVWMAERGKPNAHRSPSYEINLVNSGNTTTADNRLVMSVKLGWDVKDPRVSKCLVDSLLKDATASGWAIYPALRCANASTLQGGLTLCPFAHESITTGIVLFASQVARMHAKHQIPCFLDPQRNIMTRNVSEAACMLISRAVRSFVVLPLTKEIAQVFKLEILLTLADEIITSCQIVRVSATSLEKRRLLFLPSDINRNLFFNPLTESLRHVSLQGFMNRSITLALEALAIPEVACVIYSVQ
ncbi:hypothetical protein GMRT_10284 [Giardia muris]|uniref:Uncharacterized protein n=1 Tax=Giardia muris TaxID=5742 RepID=A0A4Z1SU29_GIAMU|nr:hypothetical protein GMRT_10284 [Giardia muris]|eukprot:TNJ29422.1 hypothetical protein GMRT_10284 [Giardia muris]